MRWLAIVAFCLPAFGQAGPEAEANMQCIERLEIPEYPPLAGQAQIQGTVTAAVTVAPNGSAAIKAEGHKLLVPGVEEAIQASTFRKDCAGKTVSLVFHFVLDEAGGSYAPLAHQRVSFSYPNQFSIKIPPRFIEP